MFILKEHFPIGINFIKICIGHKKGQGCFLVIKRCQIGITIFAVGFIQPHDKLIRVKIAFNNCTFNKPTYPISPAALFFCDVRFAVLLNQVKNLRLLLFLLLPLGVLGISALS
jgi:hypothetical protein